MSARGISDLQRDTMSAVIRSQPHWFRARTSGERVTLASLFRGGMLDRRAWRGNDGEANAAYEYRPSLRVFGALKDIV